MAKKLTNTGRNRNDKSSDTPKTFKEGLGNGLRCLDEKSPPEWLSPAGVKKNGV
jgi:hypothetical protein